MGKLNQKIIMKKKLKYWKVGDRSMKLIMQEIYDLQELDKKTTNRVRATYSITPTKTSQND